MRRKTLFLFLIVTLFCAGCAPSGRGQIDPVMQRFSEVEDILHSMVLAEGPVEAAQYLQKTVTEEPELEDVCHGLSHVIGEAAFDRFGYEHALLYENDVCGSGYIHGVVESYLARVENIEQEIATLCAPDSPKCFHGIGHGLMDRSRNNIPVSIKLCDSLPERKNKIQCAEGVFMENVEADPESHPTKYLKPDDPFFPCRGQEKIYEGVCAFYAPRYYLRLHPRDYQANLDWCETIAEGPRDACVKGVGDAAMKQNITQPMLVEAICGNAAPEREHYCIEGLVSYYIVHFAKASKGRELCDQLKEEHRAACVKVVKENESFYPG